MILFITVQILTSYSGYIPPNFEKGFLAEREAYFWSSPYGIGFLMHIVGAPIGLIVGLPQFSRIMLQFSPRSHRITGWIYVVSVLGLAVPGGFCMAFRPRGGLPSVLCFLIMCLLTTGFTLAAVRAARMRQFVSHRRWMTRSYLMMLSAIVLRLLDPFLRRQGIPEDYAYQFSVWMSWIPSLVIYELTQVLPRFFRSART